jgi:cytoskeletal protein CcmA (bactofilin family)
MRGGCADRRGASKHIWNENHVVTVGADAVVTGDIIARQITVRGAVEGTLMATGRVDIMDAARVVGRVLSQKLMLAEGGLFQGKAEPQHLDAALKVARHRRTEAAAGGGEPGKPASLIPPA